MKDTIIDVNHAIPLIQNLIVNNQGDIGRLNFILETLHKKKTLYHSDKEYLERKLNAILTYERKIHHNRNYELIKQIQTLIKNKVGDSGRLYYILDTVKKNKPLFKTDQRYIDSKIKSFENILKSEEKTVQNTSKIKYRITPTKTDTSNEHFELIISELKNKLELSTETIGKLRKDLSGSQENNINLQNTIEVKNKAIQTKDEEIKKLTEEVLVARNKLTTDPELDELLEKISLENKKISEQDIVFAKIKKYRERLTQLVSYREEYERKITTEKEKIDKQIRLENAKIHEKDKLVDDLIKTQKQLDQSKVEQEIILEQVKIEQERLLKELSDQQKNLNKAKLDYDKTSEDSSKNSKRSRK